MMCPACGQERDPAAQLAHIAICGHCGASLLVTDGVPVRRATHDDLGELSDAQIADLQRVHRRVQRESH